MSKTFLSDDMLTFLRVITGAALIGLLLALVTLAVYGLSDLHEVMFPSLHCVAAHDEFHQTSGGTQLRICDRYVRR